ncbi:hypothetical protein D3C80_2149990 [compost metagenome]
MFGERVSVEYVCLHCCNIIEFLNLVRVADEGRYGMAARYSFLEDSSAYKAGGADQCNFSHDIFLFS